MFSNMKIGVRLIMVLSVLVIMMLGLLFFSNSRLSDLNQQITNMKEKRVPNVITPTDARAHANAAARFYRNALLLMKVGKTEEAKSELELSQQARRKITEELDKLDKNINTEKGREMFKAIVEARKPYAAAQDKLLEMFRNNKIDEAISFLLSDMKAAQNNFFKEIGEFINFQTDLANKASSDSIQLYESTRTLMISCTLVVLVAVALFAFLLVRSITKPLYEAVNAANQLAEGNSAIKIEVTSTDETGQLLAAMQSMLGNIKTFINEMGHMSKEHDAGDIDVLMDASKFKGDYKVMAENLNGMVLGHIAVKKKAMACIKEFGEGNFDAPLEKFPGKKAFINDTVETVRGNIKTFINEMGHMSKEHDAGDIDVLMDTNKFKGDYKVMASGVNGMVLGHIAVKKKAMACIKEFGEGNFDVNRPEFRGGCLV